MAIQRQQIEDRTPVENVEIEYHRVTARRTDKPRFSRARLLDISKENIELGTREPFHGGEKLSLTVHAKAVQDFVTVEAEVTKCFRVTVMKQSAFCVQLDFVKLTKEQEGKIAWTVERYAHKSRPAPIRGRLRAGERAAAGREREARLAERPAARRGATAVAAATRGGGVKRPVALLDLIDRLDQFEVTDDVVLAVLEAAEAGMDVEVLYPIEQQTKTVDVEETVEEEVSSAPALPEGQARPISVYRLSSNTRLHFSEEGLPVGPATELIYLSRLKSPESCFAIELGNNTMTQDGFPSFKRGSILIFSTKRTVKSGDFAFVKTRTSDDFVQVFFDETGDRVRLRPLNPDHGERSVRRHEARMLCKLIGCYEDHGG